MKIGTFALVLAGILLVLGIGTVMGIGAVPVQVLYVLALLGVGVGIAGVIMGRGSERIMSIVALLLSLLFGGYVFLIWNFAARML